MVTRMCVSYKTNKGWLNFFILHLTYLNESIEFTDSIQHILSLMPLKDAFKLCEITKRGQIDTFLTQ